MDAKVFVDANVLVYCRDASEGEKQAKALKWMTRLWQQRLGRLSYQVLQEFYLTVTAKLSPGLSPEIARRDVRALLAWQPMGPNASVLEDAWRFQDRYRLSWWDALIVAAAQAAECQYLLSEDFQDRQELGSVKIINPFHTTPEILLGG